MCQATTIRYSGCGHDRKVVQVHCIRGKDMPGGCWDSAPQGMKQEAGSCDTCSQGKGEQQKKTGESDGMKSLLKHDGRQDG